MTHNVSVEQNGLSSSPNPPGAASQPAQRERVLFTPPVDIFDSPEGLVLVADLPGVATGTLELQIQDNRLTLLGRCATAAPPDARVVHREYEEGDFLRSFILSEDVDHDRITARLQNGVLEVVLPRIPRGAPRKIQVKSD